MKEKNSNKRLRLFDPTRDGKGVSKNEAESQGSLKRFFISLKDNFNKILYVNILMVLGNFPIIFLIATLSGYTKADSFLPMRDLFQNLSAFFAVSEPTPFSMTLYALEGIQNQILVPTTLTYVFYGIGALSVFTFGIINVGSAYVLRNIAKGDAVFTWSDFWYSIKRNWKQAFPFGIFDLIINAVLILNIYSMLSGGSFFVNTMFWANIVIFIMYFFMRYYIYVQMCTFKLSVFKILKNSLILALVGFKRNIVAFLGIIFGLMLEILFIFSAGGILLPVGVAFPLAIMFSFFAYMKVYAAYFKIKEVMIDPYYKEHPEELPEDVEQDTVMTDDVTERERLEAIKARLNSDMK